MVLFDKCPDCTSPLAENKYRCSCGWIFKKLAVPMPVINSDLCQYNRDGWQCGEEGRHGLRNQNGKWYCYDHWYELMHTRNKF